MTPTGEADALVAGDEEEVEAKDLRSSQESSSAIFMVGVRSHYKPLSSEKETHERMEAEKKAKLVGHTSWPAPTNQPYDPLPPNHPYDPAPSMLTSPPAFNVPFQPTPAFSYNPYLANWQPPQSNAQRAPLQA